MTEMGGGGGDGAVFHKIFRYLTDFDIAMKGVNNYGLGSAKKKR